MEVSKLLFASKSKLPSVGASNQFTVYELSVEADSIPISPSQIVISPLLKGVFGMGKTMMSKTSETTLHKSLFTLIGSSAILTLKYEVVVIAGVESVLVVSLAISVQTCWSVLCYH